MKKSAMLIVIAGLGMWMTAGAFGQTAPPAAPPDAPPMVGDAPPPPNLDAAPNAPAWDCPLGYTPMMRGMRADRGARGGAFRPQRDNFAGGGRARGLRPSGRAMAGTRGQRMFDGGRGLRRPMMGGRCFAGLQDCPWGNNIGPRGGNMRALQPGMSGRGAAMGSAGRGVLRGQRQWMAPEGGIARDAQTGIGRGFARDGGQFGNDRVVQRRGQAAARGVVTGQAGSRANRPIRNQLRDGSCVDGNPDLERQERLEARIQNLKAQLEMLERRIEESR